MTNEQHSELINSLTKKLNTAIYDARADGLSVDVTIKNNDDKSSRTLASCKVYKVL